MLGIEWKMGFIIYFFKGKKIKTLYTVKIFKLVGVPLLIVHIISSSLLSNDFG